MNSNQSLASLLIAAASSLGISACGNTPTQSNSPDCRKDRDCAPEQICNSQNVCIDPGQEMLSYQQKVTSEINRIEFGMTVDGRVHRTYVLVKTRSEEPIPGITVHYAANPHGEIIVAVDPQHRFQPEVVQRIFSSTTSSLSSNKIHQAVRVDSIDIPLNPIVTGKKIYDLLSSDERQFLGRAGPVNRYCMTLEQLQHSEIEIPAGLIMLASDAAGFKAEKIKVAVTTTLKEIFANWIINKYGVLPAYEVWVPRTAVNVCDEQDLAAVCDISSDALSRRVWNTQMPYWEIKGGCPNDDSTPENPDPTPSPSHDFLHIVSLSPPLTCIQFNRLYSVAVNVEYNHRPASSRCPAEIKLMLSSFDCNLLDRKNAPSLSGNMTLHGEFTPKECDSQEPPFYTLKAELEYCPAGASGSTTALDHRNIPKCP